MVIYITIPFQDIDILLWYGYLNNNNGIIMHINSDQRSSVSCFENKYQNQPIKERAGGEIF